MSKIVSFLTGIFLFSITAVAQKTDAEINGISNGPLVVKTLKPAATTSDTILISGIGAQSFIVSNLADGTVATYKQSQKIILPLVTNSKSNKYQFVFYGEQDQIIYTVVTENGLVSIYFPAYMYDDIRTKLEQSTSQRKRVELRLVQQRDGFREATLVF